MNDKRNLTVWCSMFTATMLPRAFAGEPAMADFWTLDPARGGIVHTLEAGSGAEPVVLNMQGRKVVMQVRVDREAGLSYKARFFHVDPDLTAQCHRKAPDSGFQNACKSDDGHGQHLAG